MLTAASRRAVLVGLPALFTGCSSRRRTSETTEDSTLQETTEEPTPTVRCSHAEVTYTSVSIESFTSNDGSTLEEDYVVVAGTVSGPSPPDLHVVVQAPEAPPKYVRELDDTEGSFSFRLGPFSHNGVTDITTWFEGCGKSPTPSES